jgi:large subunit ribosomal protein L20
MARVKRGVAAHRRHRKVLLQVKGHRGTRNRLYKRAHESMMRSLQYAYRDRRNRKRDMRRLWIQRINAASRLNGLPYSRLMQDSCRSGRARRRGLFGIGSGRQAVASDCLRVGF